MNPLAGIGILLIVLGVVTGVAEWHGFGRGEDSKQAEWNAAKLKAEEEQAKKRDEGFVIAAELESELHELKGKYASIVSQRRAALSEQITCPASGKVADLVVPAATVRSMLNIDVARAASGPAATESPYALRPGLARP